MRIGNGDRQRKMSRGEGLDSSGFQRACQVEGGGLAVGIAVAARLPEIIRPGVSCLGLGFCSIACGEHGNVAILP